MHLNKLKPVAGSRPQAKRVGRGPGSGLGKTAGRGHKGQKARSGGLHKVGFEGGQMPLQRRVPKHGFRSRRADTAQVRLDALGRMEADEIDMDALRRARLIPREAKAVKVIASGKLDKAVVVRGLRTSRGARAAIEAAGGQVHDS